MNKVTKAELARQFDVNQSRINALLSGKNPKLFATEDGFIDLDDPRNKTYIKIREINVPKYTGLQVIEESSEIEDDKKVSEGISDPLYEEKVAKCKKENELLDLKLKKEKKDLVDTKLLNQILMRSYEIFFNLLMETPYNIIDELRDIILTNSNKNNEDLQLLVKANKEEVYVKGLEETRKAILSIYE